jgi:exopolysaccharide production protein ExoZ
MFFYAIFAGVLFLPSKARLVALAASFILLTASGVLIGGGNDLVLTYTDPIILEFLLGAVIAKLWLTGRMPQPITGLGLVTVALLGFAFVGASHIGFGPLVFGPLAAALVLGTLALEKAGTFGRIAPLTYLGDSSYSIYLWHTLAISVVAKLAGFMSMPFLPALVIALLAGTAVGTLCYEILEKPLAAAFKRGRRRSARLEPAVPAAAPDRSSETP